MLVGVTRTDGINVPGQRVEEGRAVEVVGGFQQTGLLFWCTCHFRQACQRLSHAAHLTGNVHVPHLIAVARTCATLILLAVALRIGAIVQAIPHPESHVLGRDQRLGCHNRVVDISSNVDETCQLLMHRVIRCPHPIIIIVRAIHLNEHAMLGRDGVQIAIAVLRGLTLIAVKVGPSALHGLQFLLRGEVARLPVASQLFVPHKGTFLTLAQAVHHLGDVTA